MAEDLPDTPDATLSQGQSQGQTDPAAIEDALAALKAENAALKDQAMRYAAEAENIRRRTEREANDARAYAIQKFARDLLDGADNLSRALQFAPKEAADPAVSNFVMGVEMTEKALQTAFERNGLKRIEPKRGDRFDPNLHQAMMEQAADDVAPGCVLSVMQAGYELFGRIVRPALVAVTPKAAAAASGDGSGYGGQGREHAAGASVDAKA
jgi:molecular chaperone GrpE